LNNPISLSHLRAALRLTPINLDAAHARMAPFQRRMTPPAGVKPRPAGVLVLTYGDPNDMFMLLTRRSEGLRNHGGQISFPGGRRDPADASLTATALRETCEELGICNPPIDIIGSLSPLYVPPSNFDITPVVGYLPALPPLHPNPIEVAATLHIPLAWLLEDARRQRALRNVGEREIDMPYYQFGDDEVWGATAVILSELEVRLRMVLE
jgi:8-oxo-dGTP pyrophosphatase MutT (NUDIX family)